MPDNLFSAAETRPLSQRVYKGLERRHGERRENSDRRGMFR
jgi:hypothetical protein